MHARIEHLLSLRDGEPVDVAIRAHVDACADCVRTLASLEALPRRLGALPMVMPSADGWARVMTRVSERGARTASRRWGPAVAIAASVGLLSVLAVELLSETDVTGRSRPSAQVGPGEVAALETIAELRDRSRILEEVLAALPARPAVERADTAMPIETLQAQVQWVDHQLSLNGAQAAAPEASEQLWRERVEIMSTLVQLRYVEAQRVAL